MKRPSGLTLLTLALLILLPALAVLQYRWVGQVSEAERERVHNNLRVAAFQFRQTFDGELGRALMTLQVGAATAKDGSSERYSDRYDAWLNTTSHPQLLANVYIIDNVDAALRLRRWNPNQRTFEPVAWPPVLDKWRGEFARQREEFTQVRRDRDRDQFPIREDALLLAPLRNLQMPRTLGDRPPAPVWGFTVLELNLPYIREQFLPELAQQHFTHNGAEGYRVAVVAADEPQRVIYRSDADASIDPARADAAEYIFGRDPLFFMRRGGDQRTANIIVNVIEGQGAQQTTVSPQPDSGRWRLIVQHQSGSLESAVGQMRRRNLLVSFGVLLLLTVSVGLVTLSSRRAERLARQQLEFVAGVSHELRTPVAVIKSAAQNLSGGVVGTGDRVKRYGEMIESEARRLAEMVERVLQYAGIESGLGLGERVALAPATIVDEAIQSATASLAPDHIEVYRDVPPDLPPVLGDPAALRSAIHNLIANAVKYGGRDRWVGVHAELEQRRRGRPWIRITVKDHGQGIPQAELPHIFEPFYRGADAIARQIHGNGLGLSLVKRIVVAHGGKVSVTSKPGSGSAFSLVLPTADPNTATPPLGTELQATAHS